MSEQATQEPMPSFQKLYGRISKTAACRFNASRRLKSHNTASLWTISVFSLGLILVSLLQGMSISLGVSDKIINLVQAFLSVTILLISIILTMSNYGVRSERFHACGLELNEMALKIERRENEEATPDDYDSYAEEYGQILKRYDNHEPIDYLLMKIQKKDKYTLSFFYSAGVYIRYGIRFLPYIALLFLDALWVWKICAQAFRSAA